MPVPNLPVNLIAHTDAKAANVMADLDELVRVLDPAGAGLDDDNVGAAGFTDAALASPNNSVYRTILQSPATGLIGGLTVGTYLGTQNGNAASSGAAATTGAPVLYLVAADFAVAGRTRKLRVRANVATNATAPAVTFTVGLYPVTVAGATGHIDYTLGSVVSGSQISFVTPSASTITQQNSGDFTLPADGAYVLGVASSGTAAGNSYSWLTSYLQIRNV